MFASAGRMFSRNVLRVLSYPNRWNIGHLEFPCRSSGRTCPDNTRKVHAAALRKQDVLCDMRVGEDNAARVYEDSTSRARLYSISAGCTKDVHECLSGTCLNGAEQLGGIWVGILDPLH